MREQIQRAQNFGGFLYERETIKVYGTTFKKERNQNKFHKTNILEHNSCLIFSVKANSICGCIIKLFAPEVTHCVFCSKAQFQKQSGI